MKRTATALVCLFLLFGLAVSVTPGSVPVQKTFAAMPDGAQPPVPPVTGGPHAWMFDGAQPPVPPVTGGPHA